MLFDINDYKKNSLKLTNRWGGEQIYLTTKGTEQIFRRFSFDSIESFLAGDAANTTNGNDYKLMVDYGNITLEQLNQNRTFIIELESIKQKYLKDMDMTNFNRYDSSKANIKGIVSFAIYNLNGILMIEKISFFFRLINFRLIKKKGFTAPPNGSR